MKRAGFTMIELIFVIVILGILASVAVPKLIGVKRQADVGVCDAFYGTMNRTVGPSMYSNQLLNEETNAIAFTAAKLVEVIAVPTGDKCGSAVNIAKVAEDGTGFTVTIGTIKYDVNGTMASADVSPTWEMTKQP